jgi:hypothetical protein
MIWWIVDTNRCSWPFLVTEYNLDSFALMDLIRYEEVGSASKGRESFVILNRQILRD